MRPIIVGRKSKRADWILLPPATASSIAMPAMPHGGSSGISLSFTGVDTVVIEEPAELFVMSGSGTSDATLAAMAYVPVVGTAVVTMSERVPVLARFPIGQLAVVADDVQPGNETGVMFAPRLNVRRTLEAV